MKAVGLVRVRSESYREYVCPVLRRKRSYGGLGVVACLCVCVRECGKRDSESERTKGLACTPFDNDDDGRKLHSHRERRSAGTACAEWTRPS